MTKTRGGRALLARSLFLFFALATGSELEAAPGESFATPWGMIQRIRCFRIQREIRDSLRSIGATPSTSFEALPWAELQSRGGLAMPTDPGGGPRSHPNYEFMPGTVFGVACVRHGTPGLSFGPPPGPYPGQYPGRYPVPPGSGEPELSPEVDQRIECRANQYLLLGALTRASLESDIDPDRLRWAPMRATGYLPKLLDDPGAGPGSHENYRLDRGLGSIVCQRHGNLTSHIRPAVGLRPPSPPPLPTSMPRLVPAGEVGFLGN